MQIQNIKIKCKYKKGDVLYYHNFYGMVDNISELKSEIKKVIIKRVEEIEIKDKKQIIRYLTKNNKVIVEDKIFKTLKDATNTLGKRQLGFAKSLLNSTESDMKQELDNLEIIKRRIKHYKELIEELEGL